MLKLNNPKKLQQQQHHCRKKAQSDAAQCTQCPGLSSCCWERGAEGGRLPSVKNISISVQPPEPTTLWRGCGGLQVGTRRSGAGCLLLACGSLHKALFQAQPRLAMAAEEVVLLVWRLIFKPSEQIKIFAQNNNHFFRGWRGWRGRGVFPESFHFWRVITGTCIALGLCKIFPPR